MYFEYKSGQFATDMLNFCKTQVSSVVNLKQKKCETVLFSPNIVMKLGKLYTY